MNNKYFADAYGVDVEALKACIRKALQIAKSDDEVARIVFYGTEHGTEGQVPVSDRI